MRDALAVAFDVRLDPATPFHRIRNQVDWSGIPDGDRDIAERIRALLTMGTTHFWPKDGPVWDWTHLGEQWKPTAWDAATVARVTSVANDVRHIQIKAFLLQAVWDSGKVERGDRRKVGSQLASAHLDWARLCVAQDDSRHGAWNHFVNAATMLEMLGYGDDARTTVAEVIEQATVLIEAGSREAARAVDAVAAFIGNRALRPDDEILARMLAGMMQLGQDSREHHWSGIALDVAHRLAVALGRDPKLVASARVARTMREVEAREAKGHPALVLQSLTQQALQVVVENGLGRELLDELNERMRAFGARALEEMKPVQFSFEVPESMQKEIAAWFDYLRELVSRNPTEAALVAAVRHVPRLQEIVAAEGERGSLMDIVPGQALVGDRVGGALTRERRAMQLYGQVYASLYLGLFNQSVDVILESAGTRPILDAVSESPAIGERSREAIRDGLDLFERGRFAASLYTLLPELEACVRELVRAGGASRTAYTAGRQREHPLGVLVEKLHEATPPADRRVTEFLSCIVSSEDGVNLRNDALHGLLDPATVERAHPLIAIQALLLVAGFRVQEGTSREPSTDEASMDAAGADGKPDGAP